MDAPLLIAIAFCAFAGWGLPNFKFALGLSVVVGIVLAIVYHAWLATSTKGDALDGLGYVFAFAYPIGGCLIGKAVNLFRANSE